MRDENQPVHSDPFSSDRTQETTKRHSDTDARRSASERTPVESAEPSTAATTTAGEMPKWITHFKILEELGEGGFATVYRAQDTKLDRVVAIKVPHFRELNQADLGAIYLHEARAMARLDHPHIIQVYEVNRTDEIPCYLVTQLIEGEHFGDWLDANQPDWTALASIFQRLAEALDYAHRRGIVHRDVKPNNIFVRHDSVPFIGDFGLAIRDRIDGGVCAGTPSYMSPEQARREQSVDGRSDLFSLGVVLYRALTGRKPFQGADTESLRKEILHSDPTDPREINPEAPVELARICQRLMAKSVFDRHQTGAELASELADFVAAGTSDAAKKAIDVKIEQVVPRGLRSFDGSDAEHFLRLLPGPRDRSGLPESVRFWLSKLDPKDPRDAIPVGLIYGPSGCGKSSLVRAGVVPRLPANTETIYLQATPDATERDLTEALESRLPDDIRKTLSRGLAPCVAWLREHGQGRTIILIDQFEQWLFSHPDVDREPLTQALRQCDGEHVQCLLLVRDDFWLSISRLMQTLELPIAENQNAMLIDLFEARHARDVLMMFGAAYGRLPKSKTQLSKDQNRFLDEAVESLAINGRVVSVHLALLALILKDRDWSTTSDLFRDGGTGMGVRFLEETFHAQTATPRIQRLATGCEKVLAKLLPSPGSDIKGGIQTEDDLRQAAGDEAERFRETLSLLDGELHLITPTEKRGGELSEGVGYQLTHDFLIAPIRQWVELRNRTTKAGRAQLRLEEFSSLYRLRPIKQTLPTLGEYLSIRRNVPSSTFSPTQNRMMRAAYRLHRGRALIATVLFCVAAILGAFIYLGIRDVIAKQRSADELSKLLALPLDQTFVLSKDARQDILIRENAQRIFEESRNEADRIRAAAINFDVEDQAAELLVEHALRGPADETVAIAQNAFSSMSEEIKQAAITAWNEPSTSSSQRVRAACLMANDDTLREQLLEPQQMKLLLDVLLAESPVRSALWATGFSSMTDAMVPQLRERLVDRHREASLLTAVNLVLRFASDDTELVVELIRNAKPDEFQLLVDALAQNPDGLDVLKRQWKQMSLDPALPWGSPWWVIGDRRPLKGPFTKLQLTEQETDTFEAIVRPHAAMMHRLPERELHLMLERAKRSGYRVADAAPYRDGDERCFFVLWIRDGAPCVFEWDLTAEQLRKRNREQRRAGWTPDNLEVLPGG